MLKRDDMLNGKRFLSGSSEQGNLLPTYPSDLVREDHPARILNEIVDLIDLSVLYDKYSQEGGKSFHPKSLIKVLFYGYTNGNRSSRKLSQSCRENFVYMFLSGGVFPDFRTISEFRKNNFDILQSIFEQIVRICHKLGMISFGTISIDGSKIKANASDNRVVKKERLEKAREGIEKEITQMLNEAESIDERENTQLGPSNSGEEIPDRIKKAKQRKKEIQSLLDEMKQQNRSTLSLTDKESRFMKNNGRLQLSYNGQCATENQVILVYDINNLEADKDQLISMIDKLEAVSSSILNKQEYPLEGKCLLTDAGYDSGKNISYILEHKIDGYIANQMESYYEKEKQGLIGPLPFTKDKFVYQAKGDYYTCPAGEKLYPVEKHTDTRNSYSRQTVYYKCKSCHKCQHQSACVKSKTGCRTVKRYLDYDPIREEMDKKLATERGKQIFKQRSIDVEPVFGHIKTSILDHGSLLVRGLTRVKGEFGLICITHNLKKIINYLKSVENGKSFSNLDNLALKIA
jgi:transposase